VLEAITVRLVPALDELSRVIEVRSQQWHDVVKLGRTHLQDAVPMTVGQEWEAFGAHVRAAREAVTASQRLLQEVPIGGTAVGTGLGAPSDFSALVCAEISARTGFVVTPLEPAAAGLAGADALLATSSALRQVAVSLLQLANDVRLLASGPRAGLGELLLPAHEPGSSIMPGKANPTQAEAVAMVAVQVMGNDATVAVAATQGNLQLNTMRPLMGANLLRGVDLLAAAASQFATGTLAQLDLALDRLAGQVEGSLMTVTALSPVIGYDAAAAVAHESRASGRPVRDVVVERGLVPVEEIDAILDPRRLARPHDQDGTGGR
jgi:fumarate hydratase class II